MKTEDRRSHCLTAHAHDVGLVAVSAVMVSTIS
jgi:hypothetical protein